MGLALKDDGKQFPAPSEVKVKTKDFCVMSCTLNILLTIHLQECFPIQAEWITGMNAFKFIVNKSNVTIKVGHLM